MGRRAGTIRTTGGAALYPWLPAGVPNGAKSDTIGSRGKVDGRVTSGELVFSFIVF